MNVQIEIPNVEIADVARFKRMMSDYAQQLLETFKKKESAASVSNTNTHSMSHLKGVLGQEYTDEQLLDEYLTEKYGL